MDENDSVRLLEMRILCTGYFSVRCAGKPHEITSANKRIFGSFDMDVFNINPEALMILSAKGLCVTNSLCDGLISNKELC